MKKRIYILEDDVDIAYIIEFLLKDEAFAIKTFPTLKQMKQALRESIPDLFILDVMLPDGNGIEICKDLKEDPFTGHIPVIVMSANVRSKQLSEIAGPDDYISKPFDLDDIEKRIYKALEKKLRTPV